MITDYSYFQDGRLPHYMEGGTRRWLEQGIHPGNFLSAVISNDLFEAFGLADSENCDAMFEWIRFFYNETPADSHGSPEAMKAWAEHCGLADKEAA